MEGQLTWLVHLVGAIIKGRLSSSTAESQVPPAVAHPQILSSPKDTHNLLLASEKIGKSLTTSTPCVSVSHLEACSWHIKFLHHAIAGTCCS